MTTMTTAIRVAPNARQNPAVLDWSARYRGRDNAAFLAGVARALERTAREYSDTVDPAGVLCVGLLGEWGYLGYGLRRGAYVGTEAACVAVVHLAKTLVYRRYALVNAETAALGLAIGAVMFAGAWLGRRILDRMSERAFVTLVEVILVALGILFVLQPPR